MLVRTNLDVGAERCYAALRASVHRASDEQGTFVPHIVAERIKPITAYELRTVVAAGGDPERYMRTATPARIALEVSGLTGFIAQQLSYDIPAGLTDTERLKKDTAPACITDFDDASGGYAIASALEFLYTNRQLGNLVDAVRRDINPMNHWPYLVDLSAASSFQLIEHANTQSQTSIAN